MCVCVCVCVCVDLGTLVAAAMRSAIGVEGGGDIGTVPLLLTHRIDTQSIILPEYSTMFRHV